MKYLSEMDLWLSLRLSLTIKAHARLATLQLRNSSLSQSGTDMWFSAFKTTRPVPLPEVFVTTRPDPVPKSKTTTRQSLLERTVPLVGSDPDWSGLADPSRIPTLLTWGAEVYSSCVKFWFSIFLRDWASSFHWLSSSIFSCSSSSFVCPASVTSPLISTIWCFRAYKPYIFCEDMILATCQCQHIFCWWVEPSLLLSSCHLNCWIKIILIIIDITYTLKWSNNASTRQQ